MNPYGEVEVYMNALLTSAVYRDFFVLGGSAPAQSFATVAS
jgi:hypothetical protein